MAEAGWKVAHCAFSSLDDLRVLARTSASAAGSGRHDLQKWKTGRGQRADTPNRPTEEEEDMRVTGLRMFMILVVAFGLLAPLALIATTTTQAQSQTQRNPTGLRTECLRNHGYWDKAAGVCEYDNSAVTKKASAFDAAKKACESKGGWFEPKLALCEVEAAAKISYQASGYDQLQQACAQKGGWYDPAAGICDTGIG